MIVVLPFPSSFFLIAFFVFKIGFFCHVFDVKDWIFLMFPPSILFFPYIFQIKASIFFSILS